MKHQTNLRSNFRRVEAIARRDLITFASYRADLILTFLSVWYFAISFFFIGEFVGQPDALAEIDASYFEFVLLGSVVTSFATLGVSAFSAELSSEMNTGTIEAVLSTSTPVWVLLTGGFVVPMAFVVTETAVFIGVGLGAFGSGIPIAGLIASIPLLILTTASFASMGILSAAVVMLVKRGDPLSGPVRQITMLLSGALYPIEVLPGWLQAVSKVIPAYYGVRGMRDLVLGEVAFSESFDEIAILTLFTVVSLPIAMYALQRAMRSARASGTLANY